MRPANMSRGAPLVAHAIGSALRAWVATLALSGAACAVDSATAAPTGAARPSAKTGIFQTTFAERSPESAFARMNGRFHWGPPNARPAPEDAYDIAQEPFDVNVPSTYDGSVPFGLVVHTDAGSTGNPYVYKDLMGPHKLIWIGAQKVPNERHVACRFGLALDAVWNMCKLYNIDRKRIYATGMSGGGRCASMIAPMYADIFTGGGLYVVGCNAPTFPDEKGLDKLIPELAKAHRYAFMTGEHDMNLEDTRKVFSIYQSMGFTHIEKFETPGMGHEFAPAPVYDKALTSVDAPLIEEAKQLLAEAKALEAKKKDFEAYTRYRVVATEYPIAADQAAAASPKVAELRAKVDAELAPELAKLEADPRAMKLRDFAAKWAAFPVGDKAKADADPLAGKELDGVLAEKGASQSGKLAKFLQTWAGYPVSDRALQAYDELAAEAFAPVAKEPDSDRRDKAELKFLGKWTAGPTVDHAREALEKDLNDKLAQIGTLEDPMQKGQKLQAFVRDWKGTAAAAKAEDQLNELIAQVQAAQGKR